MMEEVHENESWQYLVTLLPHDLDADARRNGSLRRTREFKNGESLLRTILAYGVTDLSLKGTAAWAASANLANISAPGLFYRLKESVPWLVSLICQVLGDIAANPPTTGFNIKIIDATAICGPGAKGIDWRVHIMFDLATGRMNSVEITDVHGGEDFEFHPLQKGDLAIGDCAYGKARIIAAAIRKGAHALVRVCPESIRLCDEHRQPVKLRELESRVPQVGAVEFKLMMPEPPGKDCPGWRLSQAKSWLPVRVIAARNVDRKVIWLLTTTDRLDVQTIAQLYRLRWQVELLFKRLKSLLELDELPAKTEVPAKAWLLARLLAAALIERLTYEREPFSPWGYRVRKI